MHDTVIRRDKRARRVAERVCRGSGGDFRGVVEQGASGRQARRREVGAARRRGSGPGLPVHQPRHPPGVFVERLQGHGESSIVERGQGGRRGVLIGGILQSQGADQVPDQHEDQRRCRGRTGN